MTVPPPLVDGHLDLAFNVLVGGRDLIVTCAEIRRREARGSQQSMVSLPDMRRGGVAVAFATLFAEPEGAGYGSSGYRSPAEAKAQALEQLAVYERWAAAGAVRLIRSVPDLDGHLAEWPSDTLPGLVLLMEGADPIATPSELPWWWDRGVRIIGPAWGGTRYSGGTGSPGGLTAEGRELVAGMRDLGVILDASHLSDDGFSDCMEVGFHALIASHSNARALVPGDRQVSDEMIGAVGEAGGVVGLVLYNRFLDGGWSEGAGAVRVTVADQVRRHAEHVAALIGWEGVGIGSDLDGGLGLEESPEELDTVADLGLIGDVVPPAARAGVLGGNWLRVLRRALPR